MTTAAPRRAKPSARERPMPRLAPEISTTCPETEKSSSFMHGPLFGRSGAGGGGGGWRREPAEPAKRGRRVRVSCPAPFWAGAGGVREAPPQPGFADGLALLGLLRFWRLGRNSKPPLGQTRCSDSAYGTD